MFGRGFPFSFSSMTLVGLLALSPAAFAAERRMDLSVLSPTVQEDISRQFPKLKTGEFSQADLDQLIRYLVNEEQFDSVQVLSEEKGAQETFYLNVGKTRRIAKLIFKGMDEFAESDIRREFSVLEKAVFDQQTLIEAGERVRKLYRDEGYLNASLDLEFARVSATDVNVSVTIKEGPQTLIKKVVLIANNPDFQKKFERLLHKELVNEPYTDQALNSVRKDIREEFNDDQYFQAELQGPDVTMNSDDSEVYLTFTVPNSDRIYVDIEGAASEKANSVKNSLELDTFYSSNPNISPELATRAKNYYLSKGYARVEVSGEDSPGISPHSRRVTLKVVEGPRVKIKDIRISGHFSLEEKYYVNFLKDHSSELIEDGYYNREAIEVGLKNLIIDRQNQGFLRAKIISTKSAYQGKNREEIDIAINLDEGPLTILESILFQGNESYSEAELLKVIGLKAKEPLKLNELEAAIDKIKQFYRNSGFLEMSLVNERDDLVIYNEDATLAQVKMKVIEGPQITVASILIEGNTLTKDYVILKELDFSPGDILTPQLIEESIARLQRLGHFNSVDIKTLEEKTQIANRTVVVRVADRDPGLFNLGIGANNERTLTLRGYTGIAYRNIMGTGRGVSMRLEGNYNIADIKYLERKITFGYLEPYLFDSRVKGRVNYTQAVTISDFDTGKATELKQISWSVEQDITSHALLSYELWTSSQYRDFPIDPDSKTVPNNEQVIVTTGPTLDLDYRDHPFNPTTGTFTRINAEYSAPWMGSSSYIEYWRAMASFTHYYGFSRPGWVFANSLRGGVLKNLSSTGGVPYDKKGLTLGGQSTIRGFQPGEAFPSEFDFGVAPDKYFLTTEANMYLVKSELRFPIKGAFGGAFFYDGGAVFIKENVGIPSDSSLIKDPYRDAVGIAFRYATPVGAVSFEWAYKLDRREDRNESQWPFYFSIGTF